MNKETLLEIFAWTDFSEVRDSTRARDELADKILKSLTSNFEYRVVVYFDGDDGSGGFYDPNTFSTPDEAWQYGHDYVEKAWQQSRQRHAQRVDANLDWFDKHVRRDHFVVEALKKGE